MISSPIKAFEVRDDSVSIRFSCKNYGKHLRIAIDNLCDTIKGGNPENKGHRDRYIGSLFRVDGPVPMIRTMSNAVVKMLDSLGVEPESIMYDNFG